MDGYKVARLLQEQSATKHPLIVAVTGLMPERYRQRSVDAGIAHYITKPFEFTEVREILYQFAECCSSNADRKEPVAVPVADSSQYSGVATEPERE
jgi:CheY-like chemotaxis protein